MFTIVVLLWQHLPELEKIVIIVTLFSLGLTRLGDYLFEPLFKAE